jgi:hypothetical protein
MARHLQEADPSPVTRSILLAQLTVVAAAMYDRQLLVVAL